MATEIERKFLIRDDSWRKDAVSCTLLRQAYAHFVQGNQLTFRVRIADDQAFLTLKGPVSGCSRSEFEYPVPRQDAEEILENFCESGLIEKYRYRIPCGGRVWEIDEFLGDNAGLVIAELELNSPDESFEHPSWLGREVTGEIRFYNSRLREYPYRAWTEEERK